MSIYEYDQEKHMRQEREDEYEAGLREGYESGVREGHESGVKEGHELGVREGYESGMKEGGIATLIKLCKELDFPTERIETQLQEKFHLSAEEAAKYLKSFL